MISSVYENKAREFFSWWLAELAAMLPASKPMAGKNIQRGLTIYMGDKSSRLQWEERNVEESLPGKFSSEQALEKYQRAIERDKKLAVKACSIELPAKKILRREISLPSSTEENLQNVVSFEMDRYTPFARDDVYFDVKVKKRRQQEQKIDVVLSVIKKSVLDEAIKFAAASEISILGTFAVIDDDQIENFAFIKDQQHSSAKRAPSNLNKYLAILTLVLTVVALILPIAKNYLQAEQYNNELAEIQEQVNQVRQLQTRYKAIKQDVDFIDQQTSHSMQALDLLDELSRIVPDDTFLSRLVLEAASIVRVRGSSAAASKLISIIDSSDKFVDVRFVAPVTQNNKTGKENFTIEFQLHTGEHHVAVSE